jgi:hypothetical protein
MLELSLEYGISVNTCTGTSLLANILWTTTNNIDYGCTIGTIGLLLFNKFENRNFVARFNGFYYCYINAWKEPAYALIEPLLYGYQVGLETGDNEFSLVRFLIDSWTLNIGYIPIVSNQ